MLTKKSLERSGEVMVPREQTCKTSLSSPPPREFPGGEILDKTIVRKEF